MFIGTLFQFYQWAVDNVLGVHFYYCSTEEWLYTIGGLDWWTGLVDWTTGLICFHQKHRCKGSIRHEEA